MQILFLALTKPDAYRTCTIVCFKHLGNQCVHDLSNQYLFVFSKHNEYRKTGA